MQKNNIQTIIYVALGAALIAALSQVTLSIGLVPFTLQTLAIGLIATSFKPKEAILSVLIYLLLGALGLPVFAGFSGGFAALFSPTAGFLWGFLLFAAVTSILTKPNSSLVRVFLANLIGDSLCFLLGFVVFKFVTGASWTDSLAWTVLPFVLPDLFKIAIITLAHRFLKPVLKDVAYFKA